MREAVEPAREHRRLDVKTLWALGVPLELRPSLEAAMPELEFLFPTIRQPLATIRERIVGSDRPCIATWGEARTSDLHAFVEETGVPLARLGPASLFAQVDHADASMVPYGFYLEPRRDASPDVHAREPARLLASAQWQPDAGLLAQASQAMRLLRKKQVGRHNAGALGAPTLAVAPGAVLIVADDVDAFTPPDVARYAAYAELAEQAQAAYPDRDRVFVLNGDRDIPTAIAHRIRSAVTQVYPARYRPGMLQRCDVVMVHRSHAGFDALLNGKSVVCAGRTVFSDAMADATPDTLARLLAATWLLQTRYVDPVKNRAIDLPTAIGLVARRTAGLSQARPRVQPCWTSERMPAQRTRTGPSLAPASVATSGVEPSAPILYLQHDLWRVPPALRTEVMQWQALALYGGPHGDEAAHRADALARSRPALLYRWFLRGVKRSKARSALITDVSSLAGRLFARACAAAGLPRMYLPSLPAGMDRKRWAALPDAVDRLPTLADLALCWEPGQRARLVQAGFPEERIRDVALPRPAAEPSVDAPRDTPPATPLDDRLLLVSLSRPWPSSPGEPTSLLDFVATLSEICADADVRLLIHFGCAALTDLSPDVEDLIHATPHAALAITGEGEEPLLHHLARVRHVVCDSVAVFGAAFGPGRRVLFLNRDSGPIAGLDDIVDSAAGAQIVVSRWLDEPTGPSADWRLPVADENRPDVVSVMRSVGPFSVGGMVASPLWPPLAHLLGASGVPVRCMAGFDTSGALGQIARDVLGASRWLPIDEAPAIEAIADADLFVQWGADDPNASALAALARPLGKDILVIQAGWIRSVDDETPDENSLSLVLDDPFAPGRRGPASRLDALMASDRELTPAQRERAQQAMRALVEHKISRLNELPFERVDLGVTARRLVLVVAPEAVGSDAAALGAAHLAFAEMLARATAFGPDHHVVVFVPDTLQGGDHAMCHAIPQGLHDHPDVTIVSERLSTWSLIDIADKVLVYEDAAGFDALLAGKEVWCFGAPFYSGWGLTNDMGPVRRLVRTRGRVELFHFLCIELSRYIDPATRRLCTLEDAIRHVLQSRPWHLPGPGQAPRRLGAARRAVDPLAPLGLDGCKTVWASHFGEWKQGFVRRLFSRQKVSFFPMSGTAMTDWRDAVGQSRAPLFLVWGDRALPGSLAYARKHNIPVVRMEDGFIRSVGLGAHKVLPYSYCVDRRGIYFDATRPSDLEVLLSGFDFASRPELLEQARELRARIVAHGLSKYNFATPPLPDGPYGPKLRKRVLVIGQVEDDASILLGGPPGITNNDLVRLARQENPDAQVIYKIHPDVLSGARAYNSDPAEVADLCEISSGPLTLHDAFHAVDHVYTITSLSGFEALMRGIRVTALGAPFYAGWGLTDDRMPMPRRGRSLTVDEVFAAAYLLYAHYVDPQTGELITLGEVIDRIVAERDRLMKP